MEPKTVFSGKWPTCDPTSKYHIELKVGPLKVGLKSKKQVIKKQVESKSDFRGHFLVTFCVFLVPFGIALGGSWAHFLVSKFEVKIKFQKGGSDVYRSGGGGGWWC